MSVARALLASLLAGVVFVLVAIATSETAAAEVNGSWSDTGWDLLWFSTRYAPWRWGAAPTGTTWAFLGVAALPGVLVEAPLREVPPGPRRLALGFVAVMLLASAVHFAVLAQAVYLVELLETGSYNASLDHFNYVIAKLCEPTERALRETGRGIAGIELLALLFSFALPFAGATVGRIAHVGRSRALLIGLATGPVSFVLVLATMRASPLHSDHSSTLELASRRLVVVGVLGCALPLILELVDRITRPAEETIRPEELHGPMPAPPRRRRLGR